MLLFLFSRLLFLFSLLSIYFYLPFPSVFFFYFPIVSQNTVDKLVQRANASLLIGTSSWKEQFIDALTVSAGME